MSRAPGYAWREQIGLLGHVQFLLRTGVGHGPPTTGRRHTSVV